MLRIKISRRKDLTDIKREFPFLLENINITYIHYKCIQDIEFGATLI
jgi:hypothetical protein